MFLLWDARLFGQGSRFTVILYFLFISGISSVSQLKSFLITDNVTSSVSSIECQEFTSINVIDAYGTPEKNGTPIFDVKSANDSSMQSICHCKQRCDIPVMKGTGYQRWRMYIKYECIGIGSGGHCINSTQETTSVSANVPTTTLTTTEDVSASSVAVSTTNNINTFMTSLGSANKDKDTEERMIVIVTASVLACAFGMVSTGLGYILYRRTRAAKKMNGRENEVHDPNHAHRVSRNFTSLHDKAGGESQGGTSRNNASLHDTANGDSQVGAARNASLHVAANGDSQGGCTTSIFPESIQELDDHVYTEADFAFAKENENSMRTEFGNNDYYLRAVHSQERRVIDGQNINSCQGQCLLSECKKAPSAGDDGYIMMQNKNFV